MRENLVFLSGPEDDEEDAIEEWLEHENGP